jgi:hypothetical protein
VNRQQTQAVGLGLVWIGGFLGGVAFSFTSAEVRARKSYTLKLDSVKRAYEEALALRDRQPVINIFQQDKEPDESDIPLEGVDFEGTTKVVLPEPVVEPDPEQMPTTNLYHTAVAEVSTPVETFVQGEQNQFGISYIEDEDYLDDGDGRFKGRIDIIMQVDDGPMFVMEGEPIDDWEKRLGTSILVDFFTLVPPGAEPILYVRNHRTDEDYEVVQIIP